MTRSRCICLALSSRPPRAPPAMLFVVEIALLRSSPPVVFFSSRRRHSNYWRDWSSDVCSSDLQVLPGARHSRHLGLPAELAFGPDLAGNARHLGREARELVDHRVDGGADAGELPLHGPALDLRSEERRVGKEGRCGWAAVQEQK